MISTLEILMSRHHANPLSDQQLLNLGKLLVALNKFRERYAQPMVVSSGYRPAAINKAVGGAPNSAHLTLEACDFHDPVGEIKAYVLANPGILEDCGLYMEDPRDTPVWIHLQTRPTPSGRRIFRA